MREWLRISENSISGMIAEPVVAILSISLRSVDRSRVQDAVIADSLPAMRSCLTLANRSGRGAASPPDREANTDDMSPSFFAACSRVVAVASVLVVVYTVRERTTRPIVESIMSDGVRVQERMQNAPKQ